MPPRCLAPDDPQEWLNRARSNLLRAKTPIPGVYLEDLCFDARRAAEKAIKAVLLARRVAFPSVHDLADVLTLPERSGEALPAPVRQAARLTRFAVSTRYPSTSEPVSVREHEQAVAIAQAVVEWAGDRVASLGPRERI